MGPVKMAKGQRTNLPKAEVSKPNLKRYRITKKSSLAKQKANRTF